MPFDDSPVMSAVSITQIGRWDVAQWFFWSTIKSLAAVVENGYENPDIDSNFELK